MTYTSRPYRNAADRQAMATLLARVRPPERAGDYPAPADLDEMLLTPDTHACRLWFDAQGALAAYALLDLAYWNIFWELDTLPGQARLEDEIIAWGVDALRRACPGETQLALDTNCRADDAARVGALLRNGFFPQVEETLALERDLLGELEPPILPPGFCIRPARGEGEVQALVALHRAAFGTDNMTVAERLAIMRAPEYDPALDLLAIAPDGALVAFVVAHISPAENDISGRLDGWTDPLGTHPAFRRQGLMRALLLEAFQALLQRGMTTARLGTSSANEAGLATFLALGFSVTARRRWYSKPLTQ